MTNVQTRRTLLKSLGIAATISTLPGSAVAARGLSQESPENVAGVSMAHYSPNMPQVDFYVSGQPVASAIGYGEFTDYIVLEAGTHTVSVTGAGDSVIQVQYEFDFQPGYYTTALIGTLPDSLELMGVFESSLDFQQPDDGQAHVAMAHASPDSPTFDVVLDGGTTLFENLEYGSATLYTNVPAGTTTIEYVSAGESPGEGAQEPVQEGDPIQEGDAVQDPAPVDPDAQSPVAEPPGGTTADGGEVESSVPTSAEPGAAFEFDFQPGTSYTGWLIGYGDPTEPEERQLALSFTIDGQVAGFNY